MRSKMILALGICAGIGLCSGSPPAHAEDDLILPPDLRASARSSDSASAPQPKPHNASASKTGAKTNAKTAAKSNTKPKAPVADKPATSQPAAQVEKPKAASKNDTSLSLDMKWNADQAVSGPGSLSEVLNKNINGASVGTGAEVGVKYKF